MPKKITGTSKLLQKQEQPEKSAEPLNIAKPRKRNTILKNYRFSAVDLENLHLIVDGVNSKNPRRPVSETNIIRALVHLGAKMKPETILKAVKEIM